MGRLYNHARQTTARQRLRTCGTPAEAQPWTLLKDRQVGGRKFRRQYGVGHFVLDFYCVSERLAIELDGAGHFTPPGRSADAARTAELAKVGIRVLRFENYLAFEDPAGVIAAIAAAFR